MSQLEFVPSDIAFIVSHLTSYSTLYDSLWRKESKQPLIDTILADLKSKSPSNIELLKSLLISLTTSPITKLFQISKINEIIGNTEVI